MSGPPNWVPYHPGLFHAYQQFAIRNFGSGSYQASAHYLYWLYTANPFSAGWKDLLVAQDVSGAVVACIHRLRLLWVNQAGERFSVPALHNLMADPEHRTGLGFWLLKRSLHGETAACIPGVLDPLAQAYEGMRAAKVATGWYRRWIIPSPLKLLTAFHLRNQPHHLHNLLLGRGSLGNQHIITTPSRSDLERIATDLQSEAGVGAIAVDWSAKLLEWRLFHRYGPPHAIIRSKTDPSAWAILSFGLRHRVLIARILRLHASEKAGAELLASAANFARSLGVFAILATALNETHKSLLERSGFKGSHPQPKSYFWAKERSTAAQYQFDTLATDIGFDGIPRD